ncbi:aspartyl-phosphate phosphatase Spo0E family protein [Bacillus sp. AFS073361]|uniref:aspartyl-phosphate phosphatase Spo0E family protein n=1 Tax=Bacillus sp. AFS073361 TaxID=2033511 RepID=UPI0015D4D642
MKRYNRHLLELEIEVIRSQLIKTASEKGISHPDVLSLSQLLDSRIIALQKSDSPTV